MYKICTKCSIEKPITEFHKRNRSSDGHTSYCKKCKKLLDFNNYNTPEEKEIQRKRNQKNRDFNKQKLTEYLKDKACIICGESHRACLQFDHKDNVDKIKEVSKMIFTFSWKNILKEIEKCNILCANCHAKRTAAQQGWYK